MSDLVRGIDIIEVTSGSRPVTTVRSSVIGLVGTAFKGPVNTPTLITGRQAALSTFGSGGSLAEAFEAIYAQGISAVIVAVNVLDPTDTDHVTSVADEALGTGHAAGDTIALDHDYLTSFTSLVKNKDGTPVTLTSGTDYTVAMDTGVITLASGLTILTTDTLHATYKAADFDGPTSADIAGTSLDGLGIWSLVGAESITGTKPTILIAPGAGHFTTGPVAATAVPGALLGVATRLRGWPIIESPNTNATDAVTAFGLVSGERRRALFVDPWVEVDGVLQPNSAYIAGLVAKSDNERGWWASLSNQVISGITGTSRPIGFALGDAACEADILAGQNINTIIRQNGFRLWGGRTMEVEDTRWRHWSIVRTNDMIIESIIRSHLWAVDRGITATYFDDVTESVNAYLRQLIALGAIIGGRCWADPELNTPASIQLGNSFIDYDWEGVYPCEKLSFRVHQNGAYLLNLFATN